MNVISRISVRVGILWISCAFIGCVLGFARGGSDAFTSINQPNADPMNIVSIMNPDSKMPTVTNLVQNKSPGKLSKYRGKNLDELINLLRTMPGYFRSSDEFSFLGDTDLFDAIVEYGHTAVDRLVSCMDKTEPAVATMGEGGQRVSFGTMCYVALRFRVYYEPEVGEKWRGITMRFPPSEEELQLAKKAWEKVLKEKSYGFL